MWWRADSISSSPSECPGRPAIQRGVSGREGHRPTGCGRRPPPEPRRGLLARRPHRQYREPRGHRCLAALAPGHLGEPIGAGLRCEDADGSWWGAIARKGGRPESAISRLVRLDVLRVGDFLPVQGQDIGQPSLLETEPKRGADAVAGIGDHDRRLQLPVGECVPAGRARDATSPGASRRRGLLLCGIGPVRPSTHAADTAATATGTRRCRWRDGH